MGNRRLRATMFGKEIADEYDHNSVLAFLLGLFFFCLALRHKHPFNWAKQYQD